MRAVRVSSMMGAAMAATNPEPLPLADIGGLTAGPPDAAETLVYLHGWGGSRDLWWNALIALSDSVRGISLDLPGTGGTALPTGLKTMPAMARWLSETCVRLGLDRVTLVGHSLGGNLAAQTALDYPNLVKRLVLVDAALEPAYFPRRAAYPLSERFGMTALRLMRLAAQPMAFAGRHVPHAHAGGYWLPFARRTHLYLSANPDDVALQVQVRALSSSHLSPARLTGLACPLLIVHGAHDDVVPVARARALAHALPHARLVIFPKAHHCPMDADPPAFAQTVRDFLTATH